MLWRRVLALFDDTADTLAGPGFRVRRPTGPNRVKARSGPNRVKLRRRIR